MLYQTIWMAFYNAKNLVKRSMKTFVKQCIVDAITVGCYALIPFARELTNVSYFSWIILAVEMAASFMAITVIINLIFYREFLLGLPKVIRNRR